VTANVAIFVVAAFFEIAGCFAFWAWLRRSAPSFVVVLGVLSLIAFAFALTRVDSAFAGRAYAAYGGIYIGASLGWHGSLKDNRQRERTSLEQFWRLQVPY
jgi:small multidrug resistance family-3 protein